MSVFRDLVARTAALTAIERSLLVEAGAGSGKTSVMAGRVAVLFASGVEPQSHEKPDTVPRGLLFQQPDAIASKIIPTESERVFRFFGNRSEMEPCRLESSGRQISRKR